MAAGWCTALSQLFEAVLNHVENDALIEIINPLDKGEKFFAGYRLLGKEVVK